MPATSVTRDDSGGIAARSCAPAVAVSSQSNTPTSHNGADLRMGVAKVSALGRADRGVTVSTLASGANDPFAYGLAGAGAGAAGAGLLKSTFGAVLISASFSTVNCGFSLKPNTIAVRLLGNETTELL